MSATCTVTIAATTTTSGITDAYFTDASLVSRIVEDVANYINVANTPVSAGTTIKVNINNIDYSIVYTVANT
jgi:hypothetical protein